MHPIERDIREWALCDAIETWRAEQLPHWHYNVRASDPPAPERLWLQGWVGSWYIDSARAPTEAQWLTYRKAYRTYLQRAIKALDLHWATFEALDDEEFAEELAEVSELLVKAMCDGDRT